MHECFKFSIHSGQTIRIDCIQETLMVSIGEHEGYACDSFHIYTISQLSVRIHRIDVINPKVRPFGTHSCLSSNLKLCEPCRSQNAKGAKESISYLFKDSTEGIAERVSYFLSEVKGEGLTWPRITQKRR